MSTATTLSWLGNCLVLGGSLLLAGSLRPGFRLCRQLPLGTIRSWWQLLTGFILFFLAGYLAYALANWNAYDRPAELMVPAIFFAGAIFVWIVTTLTLETATDIRRICVLEQENITDPLMKILNRRYLDRRLHEEVLRARRYGLPLAVLMLDIDYFKKVNDRYGHQVGDQVLQTLGKLIMEGVRDSDVVTRYGGEEILVILPNTPDVNATILGERLRQKIAASDVAAIGEGEERTPLRVTVSIGIAGFNDPILDSRQLLLNADRALYQAKRAGRNRVMICAATSHLAE